jgi:hypothetical protein
MLIRSYNLAGRRREKQESRDRDERRIADGGGKRVAVRNAFFSVLDRSKAKIVNRRVQIRIP